MFGTTGMVKGAVHLLRDTAVSALKRYTSKASHKALKGASSAGSGLFVTGPGKLGEAAFTATLAPAAPFGWGLGKAGGALKGVGRGAMATGKFIGRRNKKGWGKLSGKGARANLRLFAAGAGIVSAWGGLQLARSDVEGFVRNRNERDPVNAMGLNQSLHRRQI